MKPQSDKPLVWLRGDVKTPPFSAEARIEAGFLLRRLQQGERLGLPHSRPMPVIGAQGHELRVNVFAKKTQATPAATVTNCKNRFALYRKAITGKR